MLDYQIIKSQKQQNIVILLHGYGSNGYDLISTTPLFSKLATNTTFIAPTAPIVSELGIGYMWFPLEYNNDNGTFKLTDLQGVAKANQILTQFIKNISLKYNTPISQIALFGFSQGGIMALSQAFHSKQLFASVVGHSTAFFDDSQTTFNLNQNILLIHGKKDDILTYNLFEKTKAFLVDKNVTFSEFSKEDMGHNVDTQSINTAEKFMAKHFVQK